jgi:hypothetical protein
MNANEKNGLERRIFYLGADTVVTTSFKTEGTLVISQPTDLATSVRGHQSRSLNLLGLTPCGRSCRFQTAPAAQRKCSYPREESANQEGMSAIKSLISLTWLQVTTPVDHHECEALSSQCKRPRNAVNLCYSDLENTNFCTLTVISRLLQAPSQHRMPSGSLPPCCWSPGMQMLRSFSGELLPCSNFSRSYITLICGSPFVSKQAVLRFMAFHSFAPVMYTMAPSGFS